MFVELDIGGVCVDVRFKDIKNLHLSVYPPTGRVRISAPAHMSVDVVRLFALSKIGWIRKHQGKIQRQDREPPREYLERESHYIWGKRYLLRLKEGRGAPQIHLAHRHIDLFLPQGAKAEVREEAVLDWSRELLRDKARPILDKWADRLRVDLDRFYIQRMKTKWGSSNPARRSVRLNLDLVRFPIECLDYVALHEVAHFRVPNHSEKFKALLDQNMPGWRRVRDRLNEGPLTAIV